MTFNLRAHQKELISFHKNNPYLGTLGWHGMGLGKTLSSLVIADEHLKTLKSQGVPNPRFIVIMPKSAMATWRTECRKFLPELYKSMVLYPYSQLHKAMRMIDYIDIRFIIFDESHYLKSPETKRTQALSEFLLKLGSTKGSFQGGKFMFLTGTPMPNHAAEIYSTWALCTGQDATDAARRLVDPVRYDNWKNAYTKVEVKTWTIGKNKPKDQQRKGVSYKAEGVDNADQFAQLIGPITHFKRVEDCIDLPEKNEILIDLELADDKLLENANIEEPEFYMALVERLSRAKTPHMVDWITDFVNGNPNEQLVVFSSHVFALRALQEALPKHVKLIIGEMSTGERTRHLTEFQNGQFQVLALSYACGSESLNLQNARHALYLGYPWTDGRLKQAMARIYRQGQQRPTFHHFMVSGQNDIRVLNLVKRKEEATTTVEDLLLGNDKKFSIDSLI